ncbi:hypothetical protein J8J27_27955, partial [Mycobacterium tuberculosis]|nr:hypothetical protein [Mycobacterium tuberculosis]
MRSLRLCFGVLSKEGAGVDAAGGPAAAGAGVKDLTNFRHPRRGRKVAATRWARRVVARMRAVNGLG